MTASRFGVKLLHVPASRVGKWAIFDRNSPLFIQGKEYPSIVSYHRTRDIARKTARIMNDHKFFAYHR